MRTLRWTLLLMAALGLGCIAVVAPGPVPPAQYGPWRSCRIGGGGYVQNVVPCPSNPKRFYAYVDVGGACRSADGGRTWTMLHGALPARTPNYEARGLTVDPRDADKVLLAVGSQWSAPEGVYASDDAGRTWRKTLTAQFMGNGPDRWTGFLIARSPGNPDVLVVASEGAGLYRSADDGRTWTKLGMTGLHPTDIRFDRTDPRRLWLCARPFKDWLGGKITPLSGGFYRSEDGGKSWAKALEDAPSEILQDPKIAARLYGIFDNHIRLSDDSGATWQDGSDGLPTGPSGGGNSETGFQALAAGPDFVLTASTNGTFYRMPSGGTRWQKITRQGLTENYYGRPWFGAGTGRFGQALGSITVDPHDPNRWFFTDWFSIYQTTDAGLRWSLSDDGLETTVIHCITQDPSDPKIVHLGMADNGYFRSDDGGNRFVSVTSISNNVKCISVSPAHPRRVYAVGPRMWDWAANQVFVSDDSGLTWKRPAMTGLPDMSQHHCNTILADLDDPDTVYLAVSLSAGPGGGGIYRSGDSGQTWAWMGAGLPTGEAVFHHDIWNLGREIAVGPNGALVAISRDHGQVFRWDAAKKRWAAAQIILRGQPNEIVAAPTAFFLAVNGDGIYKSADGDTNWTKVWAGDASHITVDAAHPNRVAAGTADGVILSRNDGRTWTQLDRRLPYRVGNVVAFAGDRLLAGSGGSGVFWMPLPAAR